MKLRLLVLLALGGALAALLSAQAAQAHKTNWSWTESYAEARVIKTVRYPAPSYEKEETQDVYNEAKARYEAAVRESQACQCGYDEVSRAIDPYSQAEENLIEARRGHPVVDATCIGSGPAVNRIRFRHFRCVVLIHFPASVEGYGYAQESLRRGRVYIHVRDRTRLYYKWI
jgi:hypothetical protein